MQTNTTYTYFLCFLQCNEKQDTRDREDLVKAVKLLGQKLGNVTILCKGQTDIISDGVNGKLVILLV